MQNLIIAIILLVIVSLVIFYLNREKKKGKKCVGCPYAAGCTKCNNKNV